MKKKLLSMLLACTIMCTCQIPVSAELLSPSDEILNAEAEELSERAESLIDLSAQSIVDGDYDTYDEINAELEEMGVQEVSYEDVVKLTASEESCEGISVYSSPSNVSFRTQYLNYTKDGKTYDLMRVYATPTSAISSLHRCDSKTMQFKSTSNKVTASAVAGLTMGISTLGGVASDTLSAVFSVYDLVKGIYTACSSSSILNNVMSTYVWNIAESCSFVYFKEKSDQMWHLKGRFSFASASVGVTIPSITINGTIAYSNMVQRSYGGQAVPKYYNRLERPFNCFINGGIYEARISNVVIFGLSGSVIRNQRLSNPLEPAEVY